MAIACTGWVGRVRAVAGNPAGARILVLAVALLVFTVKVWMAVHTYGTNDVRTFIGFAKGVHDRGPVGVYGIDYKSGPHHWLYNHPPLVGYFLQLINLLSEHGIPLRVALRTAASAADVISGLVVYEVVRRRRGVPMAAYSGSAVAASPVLFLVSGYHGNTDPIFLMLLMLGSYLVIDRALGFWGGVSLGLALGIKIVTFVALPALAVYLLVHRRQQLLRALCGFAITVAVTWGPAVVREWGPLRHNVLGYTGVGDRAWSIAKFADEAGWKAVSRFLQGPGAHLIPLLCAVLPALLVWRAANMAMESVAISLVATLAFLPAFGIQYLAWAAAAAFVLTEVWATLYNVLGGVVIFHVYNYWNRGHWTTMAGARVTTRGTLELLALLWVSLMAVLVAGLRRAVSGAARREAADSAVAS